MSALSVSMTAISSVAALVTVPLALELATDRFGADSLAEDVSMGGIVLRVFLITIVPLAIGMALRRGRPSGFRRSSRARRRSPWSRSSSSVIGAVAAEIELVLENFVDVAAAALSLNVAAMAVSFSIARLARLDGRQSTAIAMELGIHNATLAIAVGASVATVLTIPAAVYSAFMFITAGAFARVMHQRNAVAAAAAA